jgi:dTDP-4-amino-4,6-dideoxygalactose transaminase
MAQHPAEGSAELRAIRPTWPTRQAHLGFLMSQEPSAFSFSGTFHPILQQNGIPVFVDIEPRTYNIDPEQIEAKINDRTKVLMPVHIHGLPADMEPIAALAAKHGLIVIEDACQAHGATYKGQTAGTVGAMGCFSLNVTKKLSGGEAGFLNTDIDEYVERAKMIRTFGEKVGEEKEKI